MDSINRIYSTASKKAISLEMLASTEILPLYENDNPHFV